jgi:hypothetical protein
LEPDLGGVLGGIDGLTEGGVLEDYIAAVLAWVLAWEMGVGGLGEVKWLTKGGLGRFAGSTS